MQKLKDKFAANVTNFSQFTYCERDGCTVGAIGWGREALYLVCQSGKPIIALFRPALLLIYFITDD